MKITKQHSARRGEKQEGEKKCPKCGKYFKPKTSIQKYCMERKPCIQEYLDKTKIKPKSKNPKNSHPHLYITQNKKDLQNTINRIVREIDKGCRCIDCDLTKTKQWDAGHFRGVGSHPALRFNLHNIFQQTSHCNNFRNVGDDFAEGIKRMYGQAYLIQVLCLEKKYPLIKISAASLPMLKKEANAILRELKKEDKRYTPSERIELRGDINIRLGIY